MHSFFFGASNQGTVYTSCRSFVHLLLSMHLEGSVKSSYVVASHRLDWINLVEIVTHEGEVPVLKISKVLNKLVSNCFQCLVGSALFLSCGRNAPDFESLAGSYHSLAAYAVLIEAGIGGITLQAF